MLTSQPGAIPGKFNPILSQSTVFFVGLLLKGDAGGLRFFCCSSQAEAGGPAQGPCELTDLVSAAVGAEKPCCKAKSQSPALAPKT